LTQLLKGGSLEGNRIAAIVQLCETALKSSREIEEDFSRGIAKVALLHPWPADRDGWATAGFCGIPTAGLTHIGGYFDVGKIQASGKAMSNVTLMHRLSKDFCCSDEKNYPHIEAAFDYYRKDMKLSELFIIRKEKDRIEKNPFELKLISQYQDYLLYQKSL
jgi:hypothetical protein